MSNDQMQLANNSPASSLTTTKPANKQYYIEYPRNCGNEYTVYVAATPETVAWCKAQVENHAGISQTTFARVTRGHAIHRGIFALRENVRDDRMGYATDELAGGLFGIGWDVIDNCVNDSYSRIVEKSAAALEREVEGERSIEAGAPR